MTATEEVIPAGWQWGQWAERTKQLKAIPPQVRKILAFEWARAAVESARSVLHLFENRFPDDDRPRKAIEAAEKLIAKPNSSAAADAAADAAARAAAAADAAAADAAAAAAADAARAADAADAAGWKWVYRTYRACRGPKGVVFDPAWRTETTVAIARAIHTTRAFDRMPILADALQEAGCELDDELTRLRSGGGDVTAADWCLWSILQLDQE